jgi:hypothetical protein
VTETISVTRKINNLEDIHCVRDAGVAGSNPATPTKISLRFSVFFHDSQPSQPRKFKQNFNRHAEESGSFRRVQRISANLVAGLRGQPDAAQSKYVRVSAASSCPN